MFTYRKMLSLSIIFYLILRAQGSNVTTDGQARAADPGQFPFIVRIYMQDLSYSLSCTGTIIQEGVIMTSGRCCKVDSSSELVVFGNTNHTTFNENNDREFNYIYRVKNKYIHPNMEGNSGRVKHDVCMLNLQDSMRRDGHRVAELRKKNGDNSACIVVGWNQRGPNISSHVLAYRKVDVFTCGDFYCVRNGSGCPGEAGSALLCDGKLVGIGSSGVPATRSNDNCDSGQEYYGRVADNKLFIDQILCSNYPISRYSLYTSRGFNLLIQPAQFTLLTSFLTLLLVI